ncbi:histidine phosphotransferase family protein [Oceanicella sp. SM1341]|uniref:histidine phosphotransferase family protein n=1 Tax=Oceanicella sp. SM1341 TaxID=1548889 RepID=UPI001300BC96|nr:histidine phosphotransferase family protein [Oceanicella sp. SM1341]
MSDTPAKDPIALATLVSSRVCHDLISPIGAVGNGLELLQSLIPPSPELALLAESADTASAKLRFFRVAFGAAGEEVLDARGLAQGLSGMYAGGRINVEWEATALRRREARLMFLMVLCAESALPLGGTVHVEVDEGAIRLYAEGRRTRFEPGPWAHLCQGEPFAECSSAQVHFLLLRAFAAEETLTPTLSEGEGGFAIVLSGLM